jgi:hypothetical protein
MTTMTRLQEHYRKTVIPALKQKFSYQNEAADSQGA